MSLPILLFITAALIFIILMLSLLSYHRRKINAIEKKVEHQKRNHDYLIYLLRDLEDIVGYGSNYSFIVDTITRSLENTFPHSTISSIYLLDNKVVFKSIAKETVSSAFIDKVKDSSLAALNLEQYQKHEITEQISGVNLDNLGASEIKSSAEIDITINFKQVAIITLTSTRPNLYSDLDKSTFETVSYLVSGFLSRVEILTWLEKSKSLAMIDTFTDGIFMVDLNNELIAMNDSAMNFLKLEKKPDINQVLAALPNTYNFKDKINRAIIENHKIEEDDVGINNKYLKIIITPVHEIKTDSANVKTHQPTVIGASVLLHDITVEKSLSQMRDDFTNIMVHELRSPLTAIKASSEFLTSKADLTIEEKTKLIQMISDSSNKMLDKIALILDAAKMESGLFTIRKSESDLKKLLEARVAEFKAIATKKSINFRANIDPAIPVFAFDKTRIDEVVNNLLSNSLKFTPEHGTITLTATLSSDRVLVGVTDSGEGIAKDKQGKLFSKYQQAPSDGEHVGTGLGLYVVKEVVESHGGTVSLDSEVGRGTTITFTLPLHPLAATLPNMSSRESSSQKMVN
jgi:signal transduction histidine kinase